LSYLECSRLKTKLIIMKKFFFTLLASVAMTFASATVANAQMISQTNLEQYAKNMYGNKFDKAAINMAQNYTLDNQGNMVFTKEISAPTMTKDELYMEMANWFVCNYDNAIQFADKETGTLIARPYIENIARAAGGFDAYNVSICPTVRANISDGKVNITYTLHDYNVVVEAGGGNTAKGLFAGLAVAAVAGAVVDATSSHHSTTLVEHSGWGHHSYTRVVREYRPHYHVSDAILLGCVAAAATKAPSKDSKTWPICNTFPFTKDSHKKASGKAFVMANVYSQVVIDNIEAALKMI